MIREIWLRWFGRVKRRRDESLHGEVRGMEVRMQKPQGRPNKTWIKNLEEDLTGLNLNKEDVFDRHTWRAFI